MLLSSVLCSQNEAAKWYFGYNAGLDFMLSPPAALTNGADVSYEGSASVADASGNLLFYTNGNLIWNRTHSVMANGTGLLGDNSTSQVALIVKQPGNQTIYFVFTLDLAGAVNGLRYSVVDMSLAAGMGSVTIKNILVNTPCAEKLTGVKHCNGVDTWVVSHDYQSDKFRANLVTAAGVSTLAVISGVGGVISSSLSTIGCMKISPNGKKLGQAIYSPYSYELYDFDAATGIVSNRVSLPVPFIPGDHAYGCEFSPDGTKFYGSDINGSKIHQWDLCAGSATDIAASHQTFTASVTGQMQLGPDGRIYVARGRVASTPPIEIIAGENMLGVIYNPNAGGPAVIYINSGQSVAPKLSIYGLPNFVSGFYKTPVAEYAYSFDPLINCTTASFVAPPLINATCSATSYTVNNVLWLFGDPASGVNNTSTLLNPVHAYTGPGAYETKLVLYNQCGGVIDTLKQKVLIAQITLSTTTQGFSLCRGQSMILSASGSSTYTWSTGATTSTIMVTPSVNTTYTVTGINPLGCLLKTIQTVSVNEVPTLTVSGIHTACAGRTVTNVAGGASSYTWSNGAISSFIVVTPAVTTSYTVTGTAPGGCTASAVTTITFGTLPVLSVTGNTTICQGSAFTLVASGAHIYGWSDGSHAATLTLAPLGPAPTHTYFVTGVDEVGCYSRLYVTITSNPVPTLSIAAGNKTVCIGSVVTVTAGGALSYTWSNGETTNLAHLVPLSNTIYTVTGTNEYGCTNTKTVSLAVKSEINIAASTAKACSGDTFTLSVTTPSMQGQTYTWLPDGVSGYSVSLVADSARVYKVVTSVGSCTASATTTLVLLPAASLSVSPDVKINFGSATELHVSGGTTYNWSPADYLSCSNCESPVASPEVSTKYCVTSPVNDCISKACISVSIACEGNQDLLVPNAFTPNNDNNNDAFCLQGWEECTTSFNVVIFNRWGEKVYESNNPSFCWDGIYKGQLLGADVYIYVIRSKKFDGSTIHKKGNITLIR